jgi:hypothetical protein
MFHKFIINLLLSNLFQSINRSCIKRIKKSVMAGRLANFAITTALINACSVLILHLIDNFCKGEEMSFWEFGKDVMIYGSFGAIVGPIISLACKIFQKSCKKFYSTAFF